MLVNMKMGEFMPLAESTKVQLYISQVFVGELGSKLLGSWGANGCFLENARKGFQQEDNSEQHSTRSQKNYLEISFFFSSKTLVSVTEDYDEDDFFPHTKGQFDN